jgi:hypothetical protein
VQRSVNRRLRLRWFESTTCHILRKRPASCEFAAMRAVSSLSRRVSPCSAIDPCVAGIHGHIAARERCAWPLAGPDLARAWPAGALSGGVFGLTFVAESSVHPVCPSGGPVPSPGAWRAEGRCADGWSGGSGECDVCSRAANRRAMTGRTSRSRYGRCAPTRRTRCGGSPAPDSSR